MKNRRYVLAIPLFAVSFFAACEHKSPSESLGLTTPLQSPSDENPPEHLSPLPGSSSSSSSGASSSTPEVGGQPNEGGGSSGGEQNEGGPAQQGTVNLSLTYRLQISDLWHPGAGMILYADSRRHTGLGQEDIFNATKYPGTYDRHTTYQLPYHMDNVKVGETIYVQGYVCADQTSDCYPSDSDNMPSCGVAVPIGPGLKPACQPVYTFVSSGATPTCQLSCQ